MPGELTFPAEWTEGPEWKAIAEDLGAQVAYLLRRCLVAEGNDPDDQAAMEALIADAEDAARL